MHSGKLQRTSGRIIKSKNLNSQQNIWGKSFLNFGSCSRLHKRRHSSKSSTDSTRLFFFFPLLDFVKKRCKEWKRERERLVYERRPRRLSTDWISRSTGLQTFTQCSIYTTVCRAPAPDAIYGSGTAGGRWRACDASLPYDTTLPFSLSLLFPPIPK